MTKPQYTCKTYPHKAAIDIADDDTHAHWHSTVEYRNGFIPHTFGKVHHGVLGNTWVPCAGRLEAK